MCVCVGSQLINNEVLVYGSHFGNDLKEMYPTLYNATLMHRKPNKENDGVRLQNLQSIKNYTFLSISKNRYFRKGKTVITRVLLVTNTCTSKLRTLIIFIISLNNEKICTQKPNTS